MMSRRTIRRVALGIVITFLLFFLVSARSHAATPITLDNYRSQTIQWQACSDGFQCGTFTVPVDYSHITADHFTLRIIRRPATNTKERLGSLIVNPGGPGASAIEYAAAATLIVSKNIYDRYDIVGFDERGVGQSDPIRCLSDKGEDALLSGDGTINSQAELADLIKSAKNFASSCAKAAGTKLGHYSTLESARDMDLLRSILGEKKLNYLGKSYGTYLGTIYASLYPQNVGKMVLDGAMDPRESVRNQALFQSVGFELALDTYLKSNKDVSKSEILKFLTALRKQPLKANGGRFLTESYAITGIASSLYDNTTGWPDLTDALTQAIKKSNPNPLLALSDGYYQRNSSGHYTSNQNDISEVISCLDFVDPQTPAQMYADRAVFAKAAPVFGPYLVFSSIICRYWQAPAQPLKDYSGLAKTPPILIIGVTRDPATPYQWAKSLHADIAHSTLLTYNGDGHTGHNRGSSCIDSKVDAYLLTGKPPVGKNYCSA